MRDYPCLFADLPSDAVELPEGWEPLKPDPDLEEKAASQEK